MIAGGNELPSTEDRELTAAQQVNSVSNEQVHALLNENLTTTPMDLVLVTNASGQLLKALEQLPDVESIAVIAADALY